MLDVAGDMRAALQHHLAAANGSLDPPIHDHAVGPTPPEIDAFGEMTREVQ